MSRYPNIYIRGDEIPKQASRIIELDNSHTYLSSRIYNITTN